MIARLKYDLKLGLLLIIIATLALCWIAPITTIAAPAATDVPAFASTWGTFGAGNGQLAYPYGIAIDSNSNIYVTDFDNRRIQKFDSNGNYLTQWGSFGSGDGQFSTPQSVAVDTEDNVYVSDYTNNRIQKFDSNGTYITKWGSTGSGNGQFTSARGIATDSYNNVYVTDLASHRIQKFDSNGTYLTKWGTAGTGDGQLSSPRGVVVDSAGSVYVVETNNRRIQKFDSNGTYLTKWGTLGSGDGQFNSPRNITIDLLGNLYVSDYSNNRVQKFDSNGTYLGQWGSAGTGNGQFNFTYGVVADNYGSVYVADVYNHRIQKFSYPPETATVVSAGSGADIQLESTPFTTFSCSTSVTEDSLATTDPSQDYPLGLVDFCLDVVPGSTNTVSLTFETDLTPSEVTARKYNPTTQTYTDVPNAEITETTLNSNPALKLTYDITDGGDLDDDGIANGTILDPVGLAVDSDEATADTLANTGENIDLVISTALLLLALGLIKSRKLYP
jgi:tripartite motif-containing protein 71